MKCYFVGMMYGRSCTKFPYFMTILQLIWLPQAVLVCDLPIKKKSSLKPLGQITIVELFVVYLFTCHFIYTNNCKYISCFCDHNNINIQDLYIVGNYIIYLYELQKQVEERAFDQIFWMFLQRVQINFILLTITYIMYILQCKKFQNNC